MKSPTQFILIVLATLSAFTLPHAKSGVRESVQMLFVPVSLPVRAVGLWMAGRLSPTHEADVLSPGQPRPVEEVRRQNAQLVTRLANLEAQLDDLKQLSAQYATLGTDLRKMVQPATVVGGPINGRQTLTIATASLSSVAEHMAVVHPSGLVGQVYAVATGGATARVLLVTDPESRLGARLVRFVDTANGPGTERVMTQPPLVEGNGRGGLVVRMLPAREVRAAVRVGDVALLDDRVFPAALRGLRLGTVRRINLPPTDAGHAEIELDPTADFNGLREVLVVDK